MDTSVVEAAGFRFNDGPLKQLSGQLPPWLQLWMPSIVLREIRQHRNDNVSRAALQIRAGLQDLHRHAGLTFDDGQSEWLKTAKSSASKIFEDQFRDFARSHNGKVIEPTHERLAASIFDRYFESDAPFAVGKDKKHEFPDATSLLMLEFHAAEKQGQVVAVSKDAGWHAYASTSAHVYCVSSLGELTSLFLSHTPEANAVRRRLADVLAQPSEDLRATLDTTIQNGLVSVSWQIKLPNSYRYRFDAAVSETRLKSYELRPDTLGVWVTSPKNDGCVAETPVELDASLTIEIIAYEYDQLGQRVDVQRTQSILDLRFEATLRIQMSGDFVAAPIQDLINSMQLGDSPVEVEITRDKLGPHWIGEPYNSRKWGSFDDLEDDIPF